MRSTSDRRAFLKLVGCGACAVAAASLSGCTIAEVFGVTAEGTFEFDLAAAEFAPLRAVGGAVPVDVGGRPALLIRVSPTTMAAVNRICTHTSCDMAPGVTGRWDASAAELVCLCHGSRFAADGRVTQGPADVPLAVYPVDFDAELGRGAVHFGTANDGGGDAEAGAGDTGADDAPTAQDAGRPTEAGRSDADGLPPAYLDRANPLRGDPAATAAGQALYAERCGGCHGADGEGNGLPTTPAPSGFRVDQGAWSDGYLYWRVETGALGGPPNSIMPAYGEQLTEREIWQLVTYLRSLATGGVP